MWVSYISDRISKSTSHSPPAVIAHIYLILLYNIRVLSGPSGFPRRTRSFAHRYSILLDMTSFVIIFGVDRSKMTFITFMKIRFGQKTPGNVPNDHLRNTCAFQEAILPGLHKRNHRLLHHDKRTTPLCRQNPACPSSRWSLPETLKVRLFRPIGNFASLA